MMLIIAVTVVYSYSNLSTGSVVLVNDIGIGIQYRFVELTYNDFVIRSLQVTNVHSPIDN